MALTKSAQTVVSSASNSAGSTAQSSWLAVGYGVSGECTITNGATGPSAQCYAAVWLADDSSGTNARIWQIVGSPGTGNAATGTYAFGLGLGGFGGDAPYYQIVFTGNTGQSVTVEARAWTTTAVQ